MYVPQFKNTSWLKNERNIMPFSATWMDLEVVIQSEVSQKEKDMYRIISLICGIQKNGTDELVCKVEIESQMQKTNLRLPRWGKGRVG